MTTPIRSRENIILILTAFITLSGCRPAKYSGGRGTRIEPYKIATVDDLLALATNTNDYGTYFILTENIDLDPKLSGRQVFVTAVIAHDINSSGCDFDGVAFRGVFDGAGHKIANLTINTYGTADDYLGLFGCIAGGKVIDLRLENVNIKGGVGSYYIGGLAGFSNKGSIKNCSSTGKVASRDNSDSIGGLVGDNYYGNITSSFSKCDVKSGAFSSNLGGLVGGNIGTIHKCSSSGAVTGGNISMWLGGLAGSNSGTISNCSSTCVVSGGEHSYNIGDFVGDNPNGSIINCDKKTANKTRPWGHSFFVECGKRFSSQAQVLFSSIQ